MTTNDRRLLSLGDVGHLLLAVLLLFFKSRALYRHIGLTGYENRFALLTCAVLLLAFFLVLPLSKKAARIVLHALYIFICVVMALDAVYFSYAKKLTSAAQLGVAGQVANVSDTVQTLIRPWHYFLILDIPLWLIWALHRQTFFNAISRSRFAEFFDKLRSVRIKPLVGSLSGVAVCALLVFGVFLTPGFRPEYAENEIYIYHGTDLVKTLFVDESSRPVDKSLYTDPDWSSSEYYGLAAGRNVIIIQVEALQNFVIGRSYEGQELTPNLNRMLEKDTLYFDHYYYQIGGANTADAEFAVNNSLFGSEAEGAYVKYPNLRYYSLPMLLKDHGYTTAEVFHGYYGDFWNRETVYPGQGFDDFHSLEDFEQIDPFPMGISDREMFRQTAEYLKTKAEPFYAFCITLSSHAPYAIPEKDREITLRPEDEATLFGLYLQAANYEDRVIGEFMEELKAAGLYDNSIILIYGDHYALTNTDTAIQHSVGGLLGRDYTIFDVFNVPFLIHIPGSGRTETFSLASGHIDAEPTLLCLLGITNDKSVMFGQNLLEADAGFVCEQTHVSIGSFINDEVFFQKPHNNIRSFCAVYEKDTMARLDPDDYEDLVELAASRITDCAALLARDDLLLD